MTENTQDMIFEPADFYMANELPVIGEKIVDMELDIFQNNEIKRKKLSEYQGKWLILFFYPADFTFVCPTELEDMVDHYEKLTTIDTEVLSVSTDTAFVHKAWHDESDAVGKITFPMAADPTGMLSRAMGVYIEDEGLALRGTFIIDPDGVLKAYEVNDNSIGRNAAETLRKVQAAQFVAKHGDKVCPAKWTPGEDTLTPGVDLIGKI